MGTRTWLLALVAIGTALALAPAAAAATPFTAGTGSGHDLAVGSDGTGHLVWNTEEAADRIGYCRIPAGGSACDSESTFLSFPAGTSPSSTGDHAQVFTPAANKVVILASCTQCTGTASRTYRFISTNNGVDFSAGVQVGSLRLNGQAAYMNNGDVGLSVSGRIFQGQDDPASTIELTLGETSSSVYDATAALVPGTATKAVYAVNDLSTVRYRVFTDFVFPATAAELNTIGNWGSTQLLSGAEASNDETRLGGGPNGLFLTYRSKQPTENRIGLRRFDPTTDSFGAASYIEGADPIENSSLAESFHSQDPSGRLHVVWRTLYDGNRLRYTHSDTSGANFTAAANLATRETVFSPEVEAGPDGNGFAAWRSSGNAIRVVPIDPQPEPAGGGPGGGGPDTTPPTAGHLGMGDTTLTPGQGTSFTFTSSEAGVATLTVQKQVKGLKVKVRGKRKCVPQTRSRLRALRKRAGSAAAFRRLLRKRRCKAYKRIGSIRQNVVAGQNTIVFSGRIAGRPLRPGRYRALLVITDTAGNVSRVERIRFRVLRRRRH
jgi:hypothetical protein